MNVKRYIIAALAFFVFVFFYEWVLHGILLSGFYQQTSKIWREMAEMQANMPKGMGFQLVFAAWTTFIFTQIFPEGGLKNGSRFGLYFGVFAGILTASWYLWLPVPSVLGASWFVGSLIEGVVGGSIIGAIYRR